MQRQIKFLNTLVMKPHDVDVFKVFKDSKAIKEMISAAEENSPDSLYVYSGVKCAVAEPSMVLRARSQTLDTISTLLLYNHLQLLHDNTLYQYITRYSNGCGLKNMGKSGDRTKQILSLSPFPLYYALLR